MSSCDRGKDHRFGSWWRTVWIVPWRGIIPCSMMLPAHDVELVEVKEGNTVVWCRMELFGWGNGQFSIAL